MAFAETLAAADSFIAALCCQKKQCTSAVDLQMITSCKHSFCNSCIMRMQVKLMPSCDLCGIPLEGKDIRPARLAMELRSHCLALRDAIANLDMTRELNDQTMLNETLLAIDPDEARRTVDEFCMSQMYQESPATSKCDLQMEVDGAGEEAHSINEAHSTHSSVQLFSSLASREEQMVMDEQKCPPAEHSTSPPPPPASKSNTKKTKTTRSSATRQQDDNCPLQPENVVFGEPHYQFFSKKPSKTYLHATKRERSESLQQPMKLDGEYSLTQHLLDEGAPNSPMNIKPSMVNDGQPAALPVKSSDFEPSASNVPSNGNKRETRKKP
uniref:RING-type domain-containing protein n=1 Tax=Plectus sambesii TaxID=2011161 RepID=A0A914USD4_9BILA